MITYFLEFRQSQHFKIYSNDKYIRVNFKIIKFQDLFTSFTSSSHYTSLAPICRHRRSLVALVQSWSRFGVGLIGA